MQVDQGIFGFIDAESATDQVRYRINIVFIQDRSTYTLRTGTLADHYFFKPSVSAFLENVLAAVVGYVDESRFVLHQGVEVFVQCLDAFSLQGWQHFKGDEGILGLTYMIDHFHRAQK